VNVSENICNPRCPPLHLEVTDESHRHKAPEGNESHFKVVAISDCFAEQTLVARQRLVHKALKREFESGLHALALSTWTPGEWFEKGGIAPDSPPCQGGTEIGSR